MQYTRAFRAPQSSCCPFPATDNLLQSGTRAPAPHQAATTTSGSHRQNRFHRRLYPRVTHDPRATRGRNQFCHPPLRRNQGLAPLFAENARTLQNFPLNLMPELIALDLASACSQSQPAPVRSRPLFPRWSQCRCKYPPIVRGAKPRKRTPAFRISTTAFSW